ncbi:hypothetical protein KQX54_000544 [Cotesia glomerata]|uniref:Nitrate/nitrite sensing protein domain-containing protein n=1 Tax=Cotesia glomerata TaxID=32391 RepID=A0AAV7II85_COTGL|nr:hypothetical protein KQX54_000544 [Cotesia glomerata]
MLVLIICAVSFICGLPNVSQGGIYFFQLIDHYAASISIMFLAFFEVIAISWFYGVRRLCSNVSEMTGRVPSMYIQFCWFIAAPLLIMSVWVFSLIDYQSPTYGNGAYQYPWWAEAVGWGIASLSLICIPAFAVYVLIRAEGVTFTEKLRNSIRSHFEACKVCRQEYCANPLHNLSDTDKEQIKQPLQEMNRIMSPRNGSCMAESSSVRSLSSDDVSTSKSSKKKSCWKRATDPAHRRGRRIQLLQMLVLPFIPILALIVQTANTLHDILIYRQEVSDIEAQVTIATDLGKVVTGMQLERSEVAFFIYTNGSRLRFNLTQRYFITDQTLMNMTTWPLASVPRDESKTQTYEVVNKEAFQARLDDFREKISPEESTMAEVMAWYTSVNAAMLDILTNQIKETDNSGVWRLLSTKITQ